MDDLEKYLEKKIAKPSKGIYVPPKRTLNDAEILRLQQLLQRQNQHSAADNSKDSTSQTPTQTAPIASSQSAKQLPIHKLFYETAIDPLWYLVEGPLIIFPRNMLHRLTIDDFVEYYRAYPRLCWSAHPKLFEEIKNRLSEHERDMLQRYNDYHNEKHQRLSRLQKFVKASTWHRTNSFSQLLQLFQGLFLGNGNTNDSKLYSSKRLKIMAEDFIALLKFWFIQLVWRVASFPFVRHGHW